MLASPASQLVGTIGTYDRLRTSLPTLTRLQIDNRQVPSTLPVDSTSQKLSPIISPWPFVQWGLDLIGPMPKGKGQIKFAVIVVDYFTKWVKAETLATITATKIDNFVWKNIICRFGSPTPLSPTTTPSSTLLAFGAFAPDSISTSPLPLQHTHNPTDNGAHQENVEEEAWSCQG
ncbi:hypothetical protein L3X38_036614 [Prunus dulcis]|uniref:Integrase catalytic domain-containing protein n=1 Tax=Prunus dulcis TaxID=3755 RepID=A0AAD4V3U9_PRUDU|nr:hypothetical protein L3X38_036614 [Prunus dulcis]